MNGTKKIEALVSLDIIRLQIDALLKILPDEQKDYDSELDQIKILRGDLPDEVQDLEDEIEGYKTRKERFAAELVDLEEAIKKNKDGMKEAQTLITKYKDQQMNVRNNRNTTQLPRKSSFRSLKSRFARRKSEKPMRPSIARNRKLKPSLSR